MANNLEEACAKKEIGSKRVKEIMYPSPSSLSTWIKQENTQD